MDRASESRPSKDCLKDVCVGGYANRIPSTLYPESSQLFIFAFCFLYRAVASAGAWRQLPPPPPPKKKKKKKKTIGDFFNLFTFCIVKCTWFEVYDDSFTFATLHNLFARLDENKYQERLRLYKRWPCSTYILNRINCLTFLVLGHVNCPDFNIFSSHGLLPSDLVAQSVERRRSNPKVVGSIPTLVGVFLCPCVGPVPSVGLTLTWFIRDRNPALHVTLHSLQLILDENKTSVSDSTLRFV